MSIRQGGKLPRHHRYIHSFNALTEKRALGFDLVHRDFFFNLGDDDLVFLPETRLGILWRVRFDLTLTGSTGLCVVAFVNINCQERHLYSNCLS